ncbi:MAG: hypothetical protein ABI851_04185 [Saprospiraceae bacterium]
MKNLLFLLHLAFLTLLNLEFTSLPISRPIESVNSVVGIEPRQLNSNWNLPGKIVGYNCNECNKKVYFIFLKSEKGKNLVQVFVKNNLTGQIEFNNQLQINTNDPLPDPCYFLCDYLSVIK